MTKNNELIKKAVSNLEKKFRFLKFRVRLLKTGGPFDGILEVGCEQRKTLLHITTRNNFNIVENLRLESIRRQSGNFGIIFICAHISPGQAEMLRAADIFFIDASANAFIRTEGLFLYNYEKSRPEKAVPEKAGSLFYSSGLKLIFSLLSSEGLLNENYRKISEAAGVSLGSTGIILHRLRSEGFLVSGADGGKTLVNRKELLRKWVDNYREKLRSKIIRGRFNFLNFESFKNWKKEGLPGRSSQWGGEAAAEILTGHLKASMITIYTREDHRELAKKLRLVPDPKGCIEILEMFWDPGFFETNARTVPPLLVYADLTAAENERNFEGAKMIYEKYLSKTV